MLFYVVGNVKAVTDFWLIGMDFLKEVINGLHALRNASIANSTDPPFLFRKFCQI